MSKVSIDVNKKEEVIECSYPLVVASDKADEIMIILQPEEAPSNPIVICLSYDEALAVSKHILWEVIA